MNVQMIRKQHNWHKPLWAATMLVTFSLCTGAYANNMSPVAKLHKTTSQSRAQLRTQATQMVSGIRAAEAALSPQELAIAERIEVGRIPCELGASVSVVADPRTQGYFDVQINKYKFRMAPVVTSTGAIRLEDTRAGAVWLQLSNKSMLMNQKTGTRLADACTSPTQLVVAEAMIKNPPPSLLEPLPAAVSPTVQTIPSSTVRQVDSGASPTIRVTN
jgi:hypothetical protein